ncbi:hypothetical protein SUGI_1126970 [Cryptomeria japonica]|nr:hypothetical protein SUGI_1126970 [Cryptomeria japonica]
MDCRKPDGLSKPGGFQIGIYGDGPHTVLGLYKDGGGGFCSSCTIFLGGFEPAVGESVRKSVESPWTESAKGSVNRHHVRKGKHVYLVDKESDRTTALFLAAIYTGDREDNVLLLKDKAIVNK